MAESVGQKRFLAREAEENRRLGRLLKRALQESGAHLANNSSPKQLQILNLACGECKEAPVLLETVGSVLRAGALEKPSIRMVGADIRDREIAIAAERHTGRAEAQCEFFVADASKLDQHAELGEGFDLTFLRHQNFWHHRKLWHRIFAQGLAKLGPQGHLVITSYFDEEHALALEAIQKVGGELLHTERNLESLDAGYAGKTVDRHIAVFRRKS
jgi:SAM-dependent methyltransferase